jgi:hypothetical protein
MLENNAKSSLPYTPPQQQPRRRGQPDGQHQAAPCAAAAFPVTLTFGWQGQPDIAPAAGLGSGCWTEAKQAPASKEYGLDYFLSFPLLTERM